jgi:hypothetical protein
MHAILRLLGRGLLFVLFVSKATAQTQTGGISGELAGTPGSFQNSNRRLDRSINLGTSMNLTDSLGGGSRPNNNGRSARLSGEPRDRLNRWFDTSVFSQPLAFTFGNVSRTLPDARNLGAAGRMNQHFRAEFFNALNRFRFDDPGLSFGSPQFGNINSQVNSPGLIQMALKLSF